MTRSVPARLLSAALLACLALFLGVLAAPALARAPDAPGRFDHYVFSLSWSPTYCETAGNRAEPSQCRRGRPFAFVIHGLWPQYQRGWPEYCLDPAPFVPEPVVQNMLELMPSRRLVLHQWRKHGTCSGLSPTAYFDKVRQARAAIVIPEPYRRIEEYRMVSPGEVESAFRAANPGLAPEMISVDCDGRRLTEVKICMDRSLGFTPCEEVDRRACRASRIVMPPMRGG